MKNKLVKNSIILVMIIAVLSLTGCSTVTKNEEEKTVSISSTVTKDEKFGAATIALSQEDMENAGFTLGDSCDVSFGNGYSLTDIPFFNGYYVKNGEGVLVAYPGSANVLVTYNNEGIWDKADLQDNESITITLNTSQKYKDIQESLGQSYSFSREDYSSDEEFCNFRALSGGNLKDNFLYRGASPVDNSRGRANYTDELLEKYNIQFFLDLADTADDVAKYEKNEDFTSDYVLSLINNNQVAFLGMGSSYQSDTYKQKLAQGLKEMIKNNGPVYIHCMEGKDRTGFVSMLMEALAGATYDEMLSDYMITYKNYYSVTKEDTPSKYDAISDLYFNSFVEYLHDTDDLDVLKSASYVEDAKNYLKSAGMTDDEISDLVSFISK